MITLDIEDLNDHQPRLLDVLIYHSLRTHLTAEGATDGDFEFLTGQLARLIVESDNPCLAFADPPTQH